MDLHTYHLYTHSILHCGSGQSLGHVDLPIARDSATRLPLAPGSSLRGVLRHYIKTHQGEQLTTTLFGHGEASHAGALSIGDAHLLLLPVRALAGVVAYATCPFILQRYGRDRQNQLSVPTLKEHQALHGKQNKNKIEGVIALEDLDLEAEYDQQADQWAEYIAKQVFPVNRETESQEDKSGDEEARVALQQRFLILPDAVFAYLAETGLDIRHRIRINEKTGVVKDGALWSEENLPPATVLWGIYAVANSYNANDTRTATDLSAALPAQCTLHLGGNSGTGSGLVEAFFSTGSTGG